jgi:4-aminobutyrate aminotransferase-like enzyme
MMAWEMEVETREIALACLRNGLVVNSTSGNVLRFLPALTVSDAEIRHALDLLWASLPEGGRR